MENNTWLSEDDLIACAAQHGYDVTNRQVERWRKCDLIPRPQRYSLGRARGFDSAYPPGACEQLVACLRLHRTERRLHRVRFLLWCEGFLIPLGAVQKTLDELAFGPIRLLRQAATSGSPEDAAANMASMAMSDVSRSKMIRTLRSSLANDAAMQRLLTSMLRLSLGDMSIFERHGTASTSGELGVADLLFHALGLDVARTEGVGDAGPWLTGDPAQVLEQLEGQGAFSSERMREILYAASSDMLEQARKDAETVVAGLASMSEVLHLTAAPAVFGWLFRVLDVNDLWMRALMIVTTLAARQELGDTPIDTLNATLAPLQPVMDTLKGMLTVAPQLAPYLNPNSGQQAQSALDPEATEALKQQIQALLDMNPEWAATLRPAESDTTQECPETGKTL